MENIAVNRLMRLINSLSPELKLELLSKLSDNVRKTFSKVSVQSPRDHTLKELFGAWSETEEDLAQEIFKSRTTVDKEISFD